MISAILICPLLYLVSKKIYSIKNTKYINIISKVILVFNFIFIIYLGINLMVSFQWDYGVIQEAAIDFAKGLPMNQDRFIYLTKYPNNKLIYILLSQIYRFCHVTFNVNNIKTFVIISIIVNAIFVEISYILTYVLAKKVKDDKFAFTTLLFLELMLPLLGYTAIYYSDTLSLLFYPLLILLYIKYQNNQKIRYLILISILSVIGFQIKATIIFMLFAIIIDIICNNKFKIICRNLIIIILIFMSFNSALNISMNKYINITEQDIEMYQFPHTHHIMMMLNGIGGYNKEDVFYTMSFPTYKEKREANIKEIERRIEEKGFKGMINHLLYVKVNATWTDGTFASTNFLSRGPVYDNSKIYNSFWHSLYTATGDNNEKYLTYTHTYWFICMIGMLLCAVINNKNDKIILCKLTIVMLTMFLIIWEQHSRYIVQVLPLIILISNFGFTSFIDKYSNRKVVKANE